MTYTYVEMDVSQPTYDEVKANLRKAGYEHAIGDDGALDMHGLALVLDPSIEARETIGFSGSTSAGVAPCVDRCPYAGYCGDEGLCANGCEIRQRINDARGVGVSPTADPQRNEGGA